MARMQWKERVVIVTGASAGIGRQTALELGRRGASVVMAARRKDRLDQTAAEIQASGGTPLVVVCDVSREEDINNLTQTAHERFGRIDVLINNAGSGLIATVEETTPEQMERLWRTNTMSTFYAIRSVLPVFRKQQRGHIITVASMSGRRGAALKSAYCVTKFAQIGLVESLRQELRGTGIHCTLVFPGATESEFLSAIENPAGRDVRFYGPMQSASDVAGAIVRAIEKPRTEIITQRGGRFLLILNATSPDLTDWLVGRTVKRKQKL